METKRKEWQVFLIYFYYYISSFCYACTCIYLDLTLKFCISMRNYDEITIVLERK